jgi:hypothetical protein
MQLEQQPTFLQTKPLFSIMLLLSLLLSACALPPETTVVPRSEVVIEEKAPTATADTQEEVKSDSDNVEVPAGFNNNEQLETNDQIDSPPPTDSPEETKTNPDFSGIVIDLSAETTPVPATLFGTNVPAWLGPNKTEDELFIQRTNVSGVTLLRIPGGSWSNNYDWVACETNDNPNCRGGHWGLKPSHFINFIRATGTEAMYTVNMNKTAKGAAALVAFFNGAVDDETVIGVDVVGNDWGTVSQWAQLRSEHGNPDPIHIKYWEIGNEVYAGKQNLGTDCTFEWGWENVWTCDGTEYVNGIGSGENRKEGFLEYAAEMKAVDPDILIGAVGITPQAEWNNWGNEVIAGAGDVMDFYIIHEYGFFNQTPAFETAVAKPHTVWGPMMEDFQNSVTQHANGRSIPVAITEYNLYSFQDGDKDQLMVRGINMLYFADTLGQMATHGFAIANQWNLANGAAGNGTDYGLIHAKTFDRYPQYYVFPLWTKFGTEMLPVASPFAPESEMSLYAGTQEDGTVSLLAINKTGDPITTDIQLLNAPEDLKTAVIDIAQAESLESQTITFNGKSNPDDTLSDAPSTILESVKNPLSYSFAPYSITLIRFVSE